MFLELLSENLYICFFIFLNICMFFEQLHGNLYTFSHIVFRNFDKKPLGQVMDKMFGKIQHKLGVQRIIRETDMYAN